MGSTLLLNSGIAELRALDSRLLTDGGLSGANCPFTGSLIMIAMSCLMAVQTVIAMYLVRRLRLHWAHYTLVPGLIVGSVMIWQRLPSPLVAAEMMVSTMGRMQSIGTLFRVWLLPSTPFSLAYDLIVVCWLDLIADPLSLAMGTTMLLVRFSPIHFLSVLLWQTGVRRVCTSMARIGFSVALWP
jgi:hypothetical protein